MSIAAATEENGEEGKTRADPYSLLAQSESKGRSTGQGEGVPHNPHCLPLVITRSEPPAWRWTLTIPWDLPLASATVLPGEDKPSARQLGGFLCWGSCLGLWAACPKRAEVELLRGNAKFSVPSWLPGL